MPVRVELERLLCEVPGLVRRLSRHGDSASYFVGDREIAHFHGDERMDVRLTKEVIRQRKAKDTLDPRVRTRGPFAEWVAVRVVEIRDLSRYRLGQGCSPSELLTVKEGPHEALNFSCFGFLASVTRPQSEGAFPAL